MVAGSFASQRKVRAAQSEGARRKPGRRPRGRRQSRLARRRRRESNRDQTRRHAARGEKGNPPRSNLRFGRQQVARQGRKSRAAAKATTRPAPFGAERDDHHEQNSAYSPIPSSMVPLAQSAERLSVEQEVAGSCPARHPTNPPPPTRDLRLAGSFRRAS